jgi:hypothetical protein
MITREQIHSLASGAGVRKIAVENFLGTIEGVSKLEASMNLAQDARDYKWNAATRAAITRGIELHFASSQRRSPVASAAPSEALRYEVWLHYDVAELPEDEREPITERVARFTYKTQAQKFADSMLSSTCKARVIDNPHFPA